MRDFSQGSNQLPNSTIKRVLYDKRCYLLPGEVDSEIFCVYEILSFDEEKDLYTVIRPTSDNLPNAKIFFGSGKAKAEEFFQLGSCLDTRRVIVDESGGVPSVGEEIGTVSDSYKMKLGNTGFIVLDYNTDEKIAMVRSNSGGGNLLTLAEANTANAGNVDVWAIQFIDGTPNFETVGASFACKYLNRG